MDRKKLTTAVYAAMLALSVLTFISPLMFKLCESPMHCYYSFKAINGLASVVLVSSLAGIFSKEMETRRLLSLGTLVAGLFMILEPSVLIGVCSSTKMPCDYGLKPVWNLSGGAIMLASLVNLIASKEVDN